MRLDAVVSTVQAAQYPLVLPPQARQATLRLSEVCPVDAVYRLVTATGPLFVLHPQAARRLKAVVSVPQDRRMRATIGDAQLAAILEYVHEEQPPV